MWDYVICGSIKTQDSDNQSLVLSYRVMRVPCCYSFSLYTCKKRAWQKKVSERQIAAIRPWHRDWQSGRLQGGIPEEAPIFQLLNDFADGLIGTKDLEVPGMVQVGTQKVDISLFDEI